MIFSILLVHWSRIQQDFATTHVPLIEQIDKVAAERMISMFDSLKLKIDAAIAHRDSLGSTAKVTPDVHVTRTNTALTNIRQFFSRYDEIQCRMYDTLMDKFIDKKMDSLYGHLLTVLLNHADEELAALEAVVTARERCLLHLMGALSGFGTSSF
jgi:hypothetical protein